MAKASGGTRPAGSHTKAYLSRKTEALKLQQSALYSSVEFRSKGGGYVAIEKGTKHKAVEIEAAQRMADKGYKMILTDEGGSGSKGDGKIFRYIYEQSTPDIAKGEKGVCKCLEHAKIKAVKSGTRVDIAFIYDKYRRFHRNDIADGMARYERYNPNYRFKEVIVLAHDGVVHRWKHDN